jgi:hypothetical protein
MQIIKGKIGAREPLKVALAETFSSTYMVPMAVEYTGTIHPCRSCGHAAFGTDTTVQ